MAKQKRKSFRIDFDAIDIEFMEEYKELFGSPIQWFVEKSVKKNIEELKIKQILKEFPYVVPRQKTN